jgi:hypothetical protein
MTNEILSAEGKKRVIKLSKDGKWRSFPKVPNLLQYVSNGNYYGRIKMGGKLIRESLDTDIWTEAKSRLADFVSKHNTNRRNLEYPTFGNLAATFQKVRLSLGFSTHAFADDHHIDTLQIIGVFQQPVSLYNDVTNTISSINLLLTGKHKSGESNVLKPSKLFVKMILP